MGKSIFETLLPVAAGAVLGPMVAPALTGLGAAGAGTAAAMGSATPLIGGAGMMGATNAVGALAAPAIGGSLMGNGMGMIGSGIAAPATAMPGMGTGMFGGGILSPNGAMGGGLQAFMSKLNPEQLNNFMKLPKEDQQQIAQQSMMPPSMPRQKVPAQAAKIMSSAWPRASMGRYT